MRCIFMLLMAFSLYELEASRLFGQMDNEISRNNDYDLRKRAMDWVRINQPPSPEVIEPVGAWVELECEATGSPAPTVQWLKENRPITENSSFKSNLINDIPTRGLARVGSRLLIHSVLPAHEGTYTCLAESGSQVASATTKLSVSGDKIYSRLLADEVLTFRNQPRIILSDSFYMDNIGSDIVLPCKVTGNPTPDIIWLDPKDEEIQNNPRITVLPSGYLRIRNVSWNDMGPYACVAHNDLGQDHRITFVYPMLVQK